MCTGLTGIFDMNGKEISIGDFYTVGNHKLIYQVVFYKGAICGTIAGKNDPVPLLWIPSGDEGDLIPDNFNERIKIIENDNITEKG